MRKTFVMRKFKFCSNKCYNNESAQVSDFEASCFNECNSKYELGTEIYFREAAINDQVLAEMTALSKDIYEEKRV